MPRGNLEFWIDPESAYYKPIFGSGKRFILFCAAGLRSSLAAQTATELGLPRVAHIDGGFEAWREAGAPTAPKTRSAAKMSDTPTASSA